MTLRERYTRYLIAQGWHRDYTSPLSRRYHKFSHPTKAGWYFVGAAGSIRFNFDHNSTHSHTRDYVERYRMVQWEKAQGYVS